MEKYNILLPLNKSDKFASYIISKLDYVQYTYIDGNSINIEICERDESRKKRANNSLEMMLSKGEGMELFGKVFKELFEFEQSPECFEKFGIYQKAKYSYGDKTIQALAEKVDYKVQTKYYGLVELDRNDPTRSVCGQYIFVVDHILPTSKGGPDEFDNWQLMENQENADKSASID